MNAHSKTIKILLENGDLDGVIIIEDSQWNSGELYSAPREAVSDLLKTDACKQFGVYLLLSKDKVYVGQSSDLAKRLSQHMIGKDWWERTVILTTSGDKFTHSEIDYIEYQLIEKAFETERLDCDNKKKGNPPKVDKFNKSTLDQYIEGALFLMQLVGINVFSDSKKASSKTIIDTMSPNVKLSLGKRVKAEAIQFARENGAVLVDKNISYAALQPENGFYWINPRTKCLDNDWSIILNDTIRSELIILFVPAHSFVVESSKQEGLKVRADKPERLQLKISEDQFIDIVRGADFSKFIKNRIKY